MPRIPHNVLNCAFYLYPSREAAESGESCGGTGFLVVTRGAGSTAYGITNHHVAVRKGWSVSRLASPLGKPDILEFDPSDWSFISGGDDLAAVEIPLDAD